jgi:hypothetical protein
VLANGGTVNVVVSRRPKRWWAGRRAERPGAPRDPAPGSGYASRVRRRLVALSAMARSVTPLHSRTVTPESQKPDLRPQLRELLKWYDEHSATSRQERSSSPVSPSAWRRSRV